MKYANVCGKRTEATKGARGVCPYCGSEMEARCGEIRINYWAHKRKSECDPWWENETPWHRAWKDHFPAEWQEKIHHAEDGEKHVADVKTKQGWIIEFQHSYLNPEERRSRDAFYPNLVWVVDGMRRKTDLQQFEKALTNSQVSNENPLIIRVSSPEEYRLLNEWFESPSLVFFDFHDDKETKDIKLWFLVPGISSSRAYLMWMHKNDFIEYQCDERFGRLVENTILPYRDHIASAIKKTEELYKKANRRKSSNAYNKMLKKKTKGYKRYR
jgi:competence protein CoiA